MTTGARWIAVAMLAAALAGGGCLKKAIPMATSEQAAAEMGIDRLELLLKAPDEFGAELGITGKTDETREAVGGGHRHVGAHDGLVNAHARHLERFGLHEVGEPPHGSGHVAILVGNAPGDDRGVRQTPERI